MTTDGAAASANHGLTVAEAIAVPTLGGSRVLAGARGLERVIERLNVMEVPDILPWVKPRELLLTTAYPLRHQPDALPGLVSALDERGLAGIAIKLGRYIDALPDGMLERADALGFPIVQLPDGVGFDDILNEVLTEILNRQAAALARSERTHRALVQVVLTGGGLPELVDEVSALLGCPTFVADPDGRVLASAAPDGLGRDLLGAAGRELAGDWVRWAESRGWCPLAVPVSAGTRDHGHIVAVSRSRPLDEDDRVALENAATVAALAITKALAVQAAESKFGSDLLHDLLSERVTNAAEAVGRATTLGWRLDRRLVVLVLQGSADGEATDRLERLVAETARDLDPAAAVVGFTHEVVVVTGPPTGAELDTRLIAEALHRTAAALDGTVTTGVSRVVDGPLGVAEAHGQACAALRIGREVSGAGAVTHFDDLGVFRLLSLVPDTAELDRFVDEILGPLAGSGSDAQDQRRTLTMLLDTNMNVAETARRLHFHYNTVRYRIAKLEAALGPFTRDARLRLDVHLALQVVRLRAGRRGGLAH